MWATSKQTTIGNNDRRGFTIVELLIVIVVIGILAAITVVVYNGVRQRAQNAERISELYAWNKQFEMYKALFGYYPIAPLEDMEYCLGSGFPVGAGGVPRCRNYEATTATAVPESTNADLMIELARVGPLPSGNRSPVGATVGPFVHYYANGTIRLNAVLEGASSSECPAGTRFGWTDGTQRLLCDLNMTQ